MKKIKRNDIICPATRGLRKRVLDSQEVVICGIILGKELRGEETYPNFEIVPNHCLDYTKCQVWRDEKDANWRNRMKRKGVENFEKLRV